MISLTGFNLFGVKIDEDEYVELLKSLTKTYDILGNQNRKWEDIDFRKRQIGVLYDAILTYTLRSIEIEDSRYENSYSFEDLNLNEDNAKFIEVYGKLLSDNRGFSSLIEKMNGWEFNKGSIEIAHNDLYYRGKNSVTVETDRIIKKMVSESGSTQNNLKNMLDFLSDLKSIIITPKMIAGIMSISIMAHAIVNNISFAEIRIFVWLILY